MIYNITLWFKSHLISLWFAANLKFIRLYQVVNYIIVVRVHKIVEPYFPVDLTFSNNYKGDYRK